MDLLHAVEEHDDLDHDDHECFGGKGPRETLPKDQDEKDAQAKCAGRGEYEDERRRNEGRGGRRNI